jgi:hypothetical protein
MTSPARALPLRLPTAPSSTTLPSTRGLLRLVPQRRSSAAKTPFALVLVVLLVGGLLGLLLLNTLVAQGSFRLSRLASDSRALQQQEQQLASQVQQLQAPAGLAERAEKLGMVPGGAPAFLRLADGKVLGQATKGKRPAPAVVATPAAPTAAKVTPTPPRGSTTWTAPRQSPPPSTKATSR